ncbi:MAG: hypothetical protein CMH11_00665 [Maritimibacter sp.]|nr:hypothetical protein [Maritimibacter sp.]|tara:strand:+ start:832 stop:1101 length:270 start_codon:yes stop_codon:yes gene_type:complete
MRTQKLKIVGSALVLAASIGTFSAFAHEGDGEGMDMMSGDKGGMKGMMQMMSMMSDMSPEDREAMTEACMNMMQSQGTDEAEAEPEAEK